MDLMQPELWLSMLKKNARLERMYQRGFRPAHALWVDTYNKQFGGVLFTLFSQEWVVETIIT